jgi:hypothetical protein
LGVPASIHGKEQREAVLGPILIFCREYDILEQEESVIRGGEEIEIEIEILPFSMWSLGLCRGGAPVQSRLEPLPLLLPSPTVVALDGGRSFLPPDRQPLLCGLA